MYHHCYAGSSEKPGVWPTVIAVTLSIMPIRCYHQFHVDYCLHAQLSNFSFVHMWAVVSDLRGWGEVELGGSVY